MAGFNDIRSLFAQQRPSAPGKRRPPGGAKPGPGGGPNGAPGSGQGEGDQTVVGTPGRGGMGWMMIGLLILGIVVLVLTIGGPKKSIHFSDFRNLYTTNKLKDIVVDEDGITATMISGAEGSSLAEPGQAVHVEWGPATRDVFARELFQMTGKGDFKSNENSQRMLNYLTPLILTMLILMALWYVVSRGLRGAGGPGGMLGSFGKSRHRVLAKESTGVTFKDVAGIDDAKEEVTEIVEFLKHPKKFMRLGGRIPRGVLLVGDPGCGKTLLAKAIAGEADVPFFSISGSDFVEMFVGVGASRVRDLFKQAKDSSPCIIFLDEIDAVGRRRGGGFTTGGHDEREQTLNAILVEMDGFDSSDQVIVIAATNRSDVLDPALTRPGRFDRQVQVSLPDLKGRLEILNVHARKVKLSPDVDLERIARATPMFSGAELAALINESAIIATLQDKEFVEQADLEEARDKVRYGRSAKSRRLEEKERIATAFHEAGHALLQLLIPDADPLHKVTIIPRGASLGATFSLPEKDRYGYSRKWLHATMRVVCGGRIAEERRTGDVSSGAAMDIQQLTGMARAMVLEWGMSERLGFVRYSGQDTRESFIPEREYSEQTAEVIDEEIRRMSAEAYDDARKQLDLNWDKVEAVAAALLKHETLTADEVRRLADGKPLTKPTVSELLEAEAKRREQPPVPPASEPPAGLGELGPGTMPSPA